MTTTREAVRARRRQRRRRKSIAVVAVVVLVAAGAGTAWGLTGSDGPRYRLATVTTGSVSQTVDSDGSLSAARVADASFAVAGTVAAVDVAVGDHVSAGQTLATMDATSLRSAVTSAKNDVAAAKETLADAEDGTVTSAQASSANGSSTQGRTSSGTVGTVGTAAAVTSSSDTARIVLTAATKPIAQSSAKVKQAAAALVKALDDDIDAIGSGCTSVKTTTTSTVSAAADGDGTISGSTGGDTTVVTAGGKTGDVATDGSWRITDLTAGDAYTVTITQQRDAVDPAKCSAALDAATSSSSSVAKAVTAFDQAVDALPTNSGTGSTGGTTTPTGKTKQPSSGTGTAGTGTGAGTKQSQSTGQSTSQSTSQSTGVTVTSEMLASYVASVRKAEAAQAVAEDQLTRAALTSPVTGTVAAVGLTKGATVAAASGSATVQVVADGPLSMSLSIPLSKIDLIKVGQRAHVTVDGRDTALPATVTYVGSLNSSGSSGSSSAYTVTVQLDDVVKGLYDGMGAHVDVDTGTATDALVVPLSAVHTTGTRRTVDVYSGGTSVPTAVTVGVVGPQSAQIKTGLRRGQQVVVADLDAAVPSSGSTGSTRGFPGGGFGGGGGFRGGR